MKVITLYQPWATLVMMGAKKVETRCWNAKYRGELLIHASMSAKRQNIALCDTAPFNKYIKDWSELPLGAILGKVTLESTYPTHEFLQQNLLETHKAIPDDERAFGDYTKGRYAWVLKDVNWFYDTIPAKGQLGFWNFQICKVCGCWEEDACIHPAHGNCHWAEDDLCSHCKYHPGEATRYSKLIHQTKPVIS